MKELTMEKLKARCNGKSSGCNAVMFTANGVPYASILKNGVLLGVVKIIETH